VWLLSFASMTAMVNGVLLIKNIVRKFLLLLIATCHVSPDNHRARRQRDLTPNLGRRVPTRPLIAGEINRSQMSLSLRPFLSSLFTTFPSEREGASAANFTNVRLVSRRTYHVPSSIQSTAGLDLQWAARKVTVAASCGAGAGSDQIASPFSLWNSSVGYRKMGGLDLGTRNAALFKQYRTACSPRRNWPI
jgi:hypothetical protein